MLVVLKVTSKIQCYLIFKKHFFGGGGVTTNIVIEWCQKWKEVSVGATTIICNDPGFTFYYTIILFPINCLPDSTSVLKGQTHKCESK